MPHEACADRLDWAVWIAGSPGVGYDTIGRMLGGKSIETHGYRGSHRRPLEWKIAVEVIRYEITDPTAKNPFWYGFGENWTKIAALPWRGIAVLYLPDDILTERVLRFRRAHGLRLDEDGKFVSASIDTQFKVIDSAEKFDHARLIDASEAPRVIAREVRKLF
jgi:hypothetical protein